MVRVCVLTFVVADTDVYVAGSLMNGLQTMPTWTGYFHNPQGSQLGLLNAIQNIGGLAGELTTIPACAVQCNLTRMKPIPSRLTLPTVLDAATPSCWVLLSFWRLLVSKRRLSRQACSLAPGEFSLIPMQRRGTDSRTGLWSASA